MAAMSKEAATEEGKTQLPVFALVEDRLLRRSRVKCELNGFLISR